ncbi:MAG: hydroxyacid dehydrogenase, partial [Patescibacteria group bacterium]
MKIAFFGLEKAEQPLFLESFSDADVSFFNEKLDENNVAKVKDVDILSVFINSEINKKVIDEMPNLKFIAIRATGYNNIDYEYAASKGIKVSNVPAYGSHTVAEFTFGLILNLSRNIE